MMPNDKRTAVLTMVRNDDFFLSKWVGYYSSNFGKENLYVWLDGEDQKKPDFCEGVNVEVVPHIEGNVSTADKGRIDFLSEKAKFLFGRYDMVIGTDVDEFLVVDPAVGKSLKEFLSEQSERTALNSISGLGVDVGQHLEREAPIRADMPFLRQRHYAKLSTRYSKTSVLLAPVRWGSGFHRTRKGNFHIVKDLYLFHFGCVDLGRIEEKMKDKGLVQAGWSRHLKKRAGTIRLVNRKKAASWDRAVPMARRVQNIIRPPYCLNKPAMFEAKIVVEIPERFSDIV